MFTHIALLKLRKIVDKQQTVDLLANLVGRVPELRAVEVGTDRAGTPDSYDIAWVCRFDDYAAYSSFTTHTATKRVMEHVRTVCSAIVVCDYRDETASAGLWTKR